MHVKVQCESMALPASLQWPTSWFCRFDPLAVVVFIDFIYMEGSSIYDCESNIETVCQSTAHIQVQTSCPPHCKSLPWPQSSLTSWWWTGYRLAAWRVPSGRMNSGRLFLLSFFKIDLRWNVRSWRQSKTRYRPALTPPDLHHMLNSFSLPLSVCHNS